ncbi:hypothetical protein DMH04_35785 [Kibdelosporangium aridum]|uniref:Uncharacterized protein n=1 Tax=Kibdelosporangium aridum TaxID=2030 RepID=A0A428YZX4_KIBAR|nr:DUF6328 family protein [Kibdelosporangium aridum]RSM77007.1 hypothetical protein DMH04_35785 [Kibdelosporangium aridum]
MHPRHSLEDIEHERWNFVMRGESRIQRLDRNYGEILQELRVAQTGVQLLLAFLLTVAFTPRFSSFTLFQRDIYVASLVLGAAANALLIAPAAFHRVVFRHRLKEQLVRYSNRFALCGLGLLMLALTSALLLILTVVLGMHIGSWLAGGSLAWFVFFWYLLPLWHRVRSRR